MSEKRLLGWEPTETHTHHYDDEGRLVRTIVTREPEWDDVERAKMLDLADYEATLCGCGLPESVADEDPDLEMVERKCPVCAGLAVNYRIIHAADKEAARSLGREPAPDAPRPEDGRRFKVRPKPPPDASSP